MAADKVEILFPVTDDTEAGNKFRRDAIAVAAVMGGALSNYLEKLKDSPDVMPSALSIGAACFITGHLMSLGFEDERKDQVVQGLVATLVLNSDNGLLSLATNSPPNKQPM